MVRGLSWSCPVLIYSMGKSFDEAEINENNDFTTTNGNLNGRTADAVAFFVGKRAKKWVKRLFVVQVVVQLKKISSHDLT